MKRESLHLHPRVTEPDSEFYGRPLEFALHTFIFCVCDKCGNLMYSGHRECGAGEGGGNEGGGGGNEGVGGGLMRLCRQV
jgi:hypothetical protein